MISQRSFLTMPSASVGSTFRVKSFLGVRSFSFTVLFSLFTAQCSACSESLMNLSMSWISSGICFASVCS